MFFRQYLEWEWASCLILAILESKDHPAGWYDECCGRLEAETDHSQQP